MSCMAPKFAFLHITSESELIFDQLLVNVDFIGPTLALDGVYDTNIALQWYTQCSTLLNLL